MRKKKQTLKDQLMDQLTVLFPEGSVLDGVHGDGSGNWIEIKATNELILQIGFDKKMNKITDLGLFKDIYGIVDTERLFYVKSKKTFDLADDEGEKALDFLDAIGAKKKKKKKGKKNG